MAVPLIGRSVVAVAGGLLVVTAWASVIGTLIVPRPVGGWLTRWVDRIVDGVPGQETLGGLDMTVRRNAFGRQVDSFEEPIRVAGISGEPFHAVFIRAPWVESVGAGIEVLGRVETGPAAGRIVAVRQGGLLATSFHPELAGDARVHALFVRMVKEHS